MPTQNHEAESAMLAACLRKPAKFADLRGIVLPEDISWNPYQWAWQAMGNLAEAESGIDVITLGDELERTGRLGEFTTPDGQFTGRAALGYIRENGNPSNAETYAAQVMDYSAKRQVSEIMNLGANWANNGRRGAETIVDIIARLEKVRTFDHRITTHTLSLIDAVELANQHTNAAANGDMDLLPTGLIDLDKLLGGGLMEPDFMIIAGRPGQGKTALMTNIAYNMAERKRRPVLFTLEMQNRQIAMRLVAMESGVGYDKQKSGKLTENDWVNYNKAVKKLKSGDIDIQLNDMPAISISQIRRELRRLGNFDCVIVDYLQLASADGEFERRDLQIGEITRGLKAVAKEYRVPVIAGAQMNRATEARADKRPQLSDLRESGSIENDADIVTFIVRDDKATNVSRLYTEKNRNGETGVVELIYNPVKTKFNNAAAKIFNVREE